MLALRSAQDALEQQQKSLRIFERLLASSLLQEARMVMAYLPTRGEVDLTSLCDVLEAQGKLLTFPRVMSQLKGEMEPFVVPPPWREHVVRGSYNILEPGESTSRAPIGEIDVVLIPGVAFDHSLYRLGFGGGYYDRFLPRLSPRTRLIGVAYAFQVIEHVPRHDHDVQLHALCTDEGMQVSTAIG